MRSSSNSASVEHTARQKLQEIDKESERGRKKREIEGGRRKQTDREREAKKERQREREGERKRGR